ncbi:MAG: sulfurtransferase [Pseudomonadota bacterium]
MTKRLLFSFASFLLIPTFTLAGSPLVTDDWVAERLGSDNLVLLHVGGEESFAEGHLPGAVRADTHGHLSDPNSHGHGSLVLELPSVDHLKQTLMNWGVDDHSTIVVYFSDHDVTNATRALFTLRWAGLGDRSYFLDGGIDAWVAAGRDLSSKETVDTAGPGTLSLSANDALVVNHEWVKEEGKNTGTALVDARSKAHYEGVTPSRGRAGHIPGALSVPWTELVGSDLRLKPQAELREIFADAGIKPGDTVVTYCHIGQYATTVILAAEVLGHPTRLYDGAFQDWANRELPVTTEGP